MYTVQSTSVYCHTANSFTNCLEVLKQHFTSKSNFSNPPQRNCSVYNETHYGNFEIGSTLANRIRVFDETFDFLANLETGDSSPVISDGEIIFLKSQHTILIKIFWGYIYAGDSTEDTFLNSLNITFQDCVKIEKDRRNQSDCSLCFELGKPRITCGKCHRIFIRQRNFDTLCTEIINPCDFEDLPAKVKEALNDGKKTESRACELYIDVMRLKLRHFVLVREIGLVIQPSLFWLVASPDGLVAYQTSDQVLRDKVPSYKETHVTY